MVNKSQTIKKKSASGSRTKAISGSKLTPEQIKLISTELKTRIDFLNSLNNSNRKKVFNNLNNSGYKAVITKKKTSSKKQYNDFKSVSKSTQKICIGAVKSTGTVLKSSGKLVKKILRCTSIVAKKFAVSGYNVCIKNLLNNFQIGIPPSATVGGLINLGLCFSLVGGVWKLSHGEVIFNESGNISTYIIKPSDVLFKKLLNFLVTQSRQLGITDFMTEITTQLLDIIKDKIGITKILELVTKISTVMTGTKDVILNTSKEVVSAVSNAAIKGASVIGKTAVSALDSAGVTSMFTPFLTSAKGFLMMGQNYHAAKALNSNKIIEIENKSNKNVYIINNNSSSNFRMTATQQFINGSFNNI